MDIHARARVCVRARTRARARAPESLSMHFVLNARCSLCVLNLLSASYDPWTPIRANCSGNEHGGHCSRATGAGGACWEIIWFARRTLGVSAVLMVLVGRYCGSCGACWEMFAVLGN